MIERADVAPHITDSPRGIRCIGMTVENQEYILLRTDSGVMLKAFEKSLRRQGLGVRLGKAYDVQASLQRGKLVAPEDAPEDTQGIYILAGKFDGYADFIRTDNS